MQELIDTLKKARQKKKITLDDISQRTKIQKRYLEALENSDFSPFAGEVYVKGAIRNYAEVVGLDPKEILELYYNLKKSGEEESKQAEAGIIEEPEKKSKIVKESRKFKGDRQPLSINTGLTILVVVMILAGVWYSFYYVPMERDSEANGEQEDEARDPEDAEEEKDPDDIDDIEDEGVVILKEEDPREFTYAVEGFEEIELEVNINEPCWIKLLVDDEEQFYPQTYRAGDVLSYTANESIWLRLGWPKGAEVIINGIEIEENQDLTDAYNFIFILE